MKGQRPPEFDIVDPKGQRATIIPSSSSDTVADLGNALGCAPGTAISVDGEDVAPNIKLTTIDVLKAGSRISLATSADVLPSDAPSVKEPTVEIAVILGPACRPWVSLGVGRHGIGRSQLSAIVVADPTVELHHGVLEVEPDGEVTFTQLTGRIPARVAGQPCGPRMRLRSGDELELGASRLLILRAPDCLLTSAGLSAKSGVGSLSADDANPWRRVVRRAPVLDQPVAVSDIRVPEQPAPHRAPAMTALLGAAVGVLGAGAIAVIFGQLMFALFALVGAFASTATWVVGALAARRRRRSAAVVHVEEVERFRSFLRDAHLRRLDQHHVRYRSVADLLHDLDMAPGRIWERRVDGDGQLATALGVGTVRWTAPVEAGERSSLSPELLIDVERCERLPGVVAPLTLGNSETVALHGPIRDGRALARSIIVQSAIASGPADWRLVVVADQPELWDWTSWLPHARQPDGSHFVCRSNDSAAVNDLVQSLDTGRDGSLLVVVDDPTTLARRTGPLRRFLATSNAACVVIVATGMTVPAVCQRVLTLGSTGGAHWTGVVPSADQATDIRVAGLDLTTAESAARGLAPLVDPEDCETDAVGIPRNIQLADLRSSADDTSRAIARRWAALGPDPAPTAAIGLSGDGIVDIDLVRDGPHALIAGTTGSGKSELLRTMVVSLAAELGPDHLTLVLVDYKGGSTFDLCSDLPHTVGVVTDLDDGLAERALVSLEAELTRRERIIRSFGASDIAAYRLSAAVDPMPRLVVVIDEFAALAKDLPDFLAALVGIAQRGRSLGIHLILATQRPTGVVSDDIRANTNLRIALRLHDPVDAQDVVGDELPTTFPRSVPGRVVLRLGPDELVVFQAARCTGAVRSDARHLRVLWPRSAVPEVDVSSNETGVTQANTELDVLVAAIREAALICETSSPHSPWLEALPAVLDQETFDRAMVDLAMVDSDAIGLVDDPSRQARSGLRWDPVAGNLVLVGSLGSGTTSTLVALAAAHCRNVGSDDCHIYVIDAKGDSLLDGLASIAHCGAVVRLQEAERLERLIRRLGCEVDRRSLVTTSHPRILLFVDGLGSLRNKLGMLDRADTLVTLDRVFQEGPPVGVAVCATTDGSSSAAMTSACAHRWIFHVDDPSIARAAGVRGPLPRADAPGRLRVLETMLEGQVVIGAPGLAELPHRSPGVGPPGIGVLRERIDATELRTPSRTVGELQQIVIGIANDDLEEVGLHVPVGDHIFIGGAAHTGKSTALRQVVGAWQQINPDGDVIEVSRSTNLRRTESDTERLRFTLVVVDDADRVDDVSGEFAAILSRKRPGVMIVAAARLDAVRVAYGHWVRELTRSRCGLILTAAGEVDGDLLGATLPRRPPIPPRPGLAWLIDGRGHRLVQVADRMVVRTAEGTKEGG
jgi:S-DNA-T family DNA segregation ATPase FtsK/SpoIIIE